LTSANNVTATTNATNMVGQILMTPTNVTQIDLGKIVASTVKDGLYILYFAFQCGHTNITNIDGNTV
jgi:hypothetical protein